jgi:hypothetical protein
MAHSSALVDALKRELKVFHDMRRRRKAAPAPATEGRRAS